MKLRHFKRYTRSLCLAYLRARNFRNTDRLVLNLNAWKASGNDQDYGYKAKDREELNLHIRYCSDRMNPGRARAILRLMDEVALQEFFARQ
jgi:hypothetical protein